MIDWTVFVKANVALTCVIGSVILLALLIKAFGSIVLLGALLLLAEALILISCKK